MKTTTITILTVALSIVSCSNEPEAIAGETINEIDTVMTETQENTMKPRLLEIALNEKKNKSVSKSSDEKKRAYAEGIQSVVDKKVVENALQVGQTAIDFTLTNANNEQVSLYNQLENGPVVLMWYRGGWCPYCNITLHHMQESLPEFKKYGANLLALSPEVPDSSISTKEKNELEFEVLSDINNEIAYKYSVVYKLTDEVAKMYEAGFGLSDFNGNSTNELPLAATYVIGQDKIIKYAFLDADYRNRAEPADIIEVLKTLK